MTLQQFNTLDKAAAAELLKCCGSSKWVSAMMENFPFPSEDHLIKKAVAIWYEQCEKEDWLEAFTHHPKIGDNKSLEEKFAPTKDWAASEQSGVQTANNTVIEQLVKGNEGYENKFGFIFIVCATGKTAQEMLHLLQDRLQNNYENELKIAMKEQDKITQLRLKKLLA